MQAPHEKTKSCSKITSLLTLKHFKKLTKNFANEQLGVLTAEKIGQNIGQ